VERRLRLPALDGGELLTAAAVALLTALAAFVGVHVLGLEGLLVPLGLTLAAIVLARPVVAVTLVVGLAVLCEGPSFGIMTFSSHLYTQVYRDISLLDLLVAFALLSAALWHAFEVSRFSQPAAARA